MKSPNNNIFAALAIGLLTVGQTVQQIYNPQDGYIGKFLAHGFDLTKINLFGNLSLENLKETIFEFEEKGHLVTACSSSYCYTRPSPFLVITPSVINKDQTTVYKLEKSLHPLLNANVSDLTAGNYSYQLCESSYYGRLSAESVYYQSYWKVYLWDNGWEFFERCLKKQFRADVENLKGKNMTEYFKFIDRYGTHFFREVEFGGMYRMESKATDRFVEDVSEADYKECLETNIKRATDMNYSGNYSSILPDFYYHNHYVNFTYGGDDKIKISNQNDFEKWHNSIEAKMVPIGWWKDTIYNLIQSGGSEFTEVVKNLKLATETIEIKYKIQSYLDALKVIQNNLYGRKIGGKCNPYNVQKYLEEKLNETIPVLDQTFADNCWCVEHDAESILNRRSWFLRPLPTVEPPFTEPVVS